MCKLSNVWCFVLLIVKRLHMHATYISSYKYFAYAYINMISTSLITCTCTLFECSQGMHRCKVWCTLTCMCIHETVLLMQICCMHLYVFIPYIDMHFISTPSRLHPSKDRLHREKKRKENNRKEEGQKMLVCIVK